LFISFEAESNFAARPDQNYIGRSALGDRQKSMCEFLSALTLAEWSAARNGMTCEEFLLMLKANWKEPSGEYKLNFAKQRL